MEQAIRKAIEGGYPDTKKEGNQYFTYMGIKEGNKKVWHCVNWEQIVMKPLFWESLGKSLGWEDDLWIGQMKRLRGDKLVTDSWEATQWEYQWLKFIDHLASGKDAESFFINLLNTKE